MNGKLRGNGRTLAAVKKSGGAQLALRVGGDGKGKMARFPITFIQDVAFSKVTARNDLAKAMQIMPRTVTTMRNLTAHCGMEGENEYLRELPAEYPRTPNLVFGSGMGADATSERFMLEL